MNKSIQNVTKHGFNHNSCIAQYPTIQSDDFRHLPSEAMVCKSTSWRFIWATFLAVTDLKSISMKDLGNKSNSFNNQ